MLKNLGQLTLRNHPRSPQCARLGCPKRVPYLRSCGWISYPQWKKRHPGTTVLSIATGHERDYSEGAAYRDYFSTDRLMFGVPKLDRRLPNKAEVLALRGSGPGVKPGRELAISAAHLSKHPVHHERVGAQQLVVLTDASGANRVYASGAARFASYDRHQIATDNQGGQWKVEEDSLVGPGGKTLKRVSAHRAFWFGWYSAHPGTRLVH